MLRSMIANKVHICSKESHSTPTSVKLQSQMSVDETWENSYSRVTELLQGLKNPWKKAAVKLAGMMLSCLPEQIPGNLKLL